MYECMYICMYCTILYLQVWLRLVAYLKCAVVRALLIIVIIVIIILLKEVSRETNCFY